MLFACSRRFLAMLQGVPVLLLSFFQAFASHLIYFIYLFVFYFFDFLSSKFAVYMLSGQICVIHFSKTLPSIDTKFQEKFNFRMFCWFHLVLDLCFLEISREKSFWWKKIERSTRRKNRELKTELKNNEKPQKFVKSMLYITITTNF